VAVVLVVDDTEAARYAARRALERSGFEVWEAATGAEALQKAARVPDAVVLDINLPDMSGLEVCRRIKNDPATRSVPVLHLTAAFGTSEDRATALDGGADAYLTQPVEPVVLVATVRALVRAREAEASARQLTALWQSTFDAIADGVALLDREGRFLRCNAAMARLMGRPAESLIGEMGVPALPEAAEPEGGWPVWRSLQTRTRERVEVEARDRCYELVADPVPADDGPVSAVVCTVKDITERRNTERQVAELLAREQSARAEAEHVNQLKDEFLATLSHELRTPLNAIVGWAQLLMQGLTDEATTRRAIEVIARNARVQEQLISDILDVSRIVAGKLRLEPRPMDLAEVVTQALETVRPAATAKGVALEAHLEAHDVPIVGDPSRLQQVVWNLLSNAIKFTPRGGHTRVRVQTEAATACITVEDDGPGIEPEFLPHVFERFRQADASSTRRHGGLGLGLAIVRHLVELHGGSVHVHNRAGAGAVFEIRLPLRGTLAVEAVLLPAAGERPLAEAGPSLDGTTVLVVDDDADARSLLAFVLERQGARVLTAGSADAAVGLLARERPQVLLADIEMPHEDGYAFIRRIRALPEAAGGRTPAAALTAYAGAHDRARALQAGFQMHLAKPIDPSELVIMVAGLTQAVAQTTK
jgi:PAS domain S-box-containing protein